MKIHLLFTISIISISSLSNAQPVQNSAEYGIECVGTTTIWSDRSDRLMKLKEKKVFRIKNGFIDKMACLRMSRTNRILCLSDIKNTNLPTIKSMKKMIDYDFDNSQIIMLDEGKVSVEDVLKINPDLSQRLKDLDFVTNDSLFKGSCKRQ